MKKTNISSAIFQEMLDSASNAGAKGQAQYFTPEPWARALALALPKVRPVLVDFNCGNGSLLHGASRHSRSLGCDIEALSTLNPQLSTDFLQADITRFYPLLRDVKFRADCFALNPPWDLHWYRENLAGLAESYCPVVPPAFEAHDGRTSTDTIDSTIATLCLALDLGSEYAEGFLVSNEASLQRLIFSDDAPHRMLADHIWAHLIIDGNICSQQISPPASQFQTGVIYFARGHTFGLINSGSHRVATLKEAEAFCQELQTNRLYLRKGPKVYDGVTTDDTVERWRAAAEEWNITRHPSLVTHPYHLWLEHGRIRTQLSLYDRETGREAKAAAARLHELNGKTPMQLVVQVSHRRALEAAVSGTAGVPPAWRVDPALQQAVAAALLDYNRQRAPLYPLPEIKRLGYLDEHDLIECKKDLRNALGEVVFRAGECYPLRSLTTQVNRTGTKLNLQGDLDDVEWNGAELGFFLTSQSSREYLFMEGRLRDPSIKVSIAPPAGARELVEAVGADPRVVCAIDFTLQELVEHFTIPDVADVASLDPTGYQRNLKLLEEIETLCQ